ncbi:MAG: carboxy terminal-processing peptidase [Sporocytophaga sp.]|uniref:carboxy terminal-processing peptidase n=1 Tax=Sporocytophaga sp. TaxID=2231183 RepID=UPI001B2CA0CF|nr:carboxy terminal-processing peptidase [Sporocytophaga sp.]MBO9701922.1 carboxy terminal-processing peptidase [Sporocytophaga sp.]
MKNFWIISIFIISIFVSTTEATAQALNLKKETQLLETSLSSNHYSKKQMDDELSSKSFSKFIDLLDPEAIYLTAQDIRTFKPFEKQIDDELKGKMWKLLDVVIPIYKQRLTEAEKGLSDILSKPFTFTKGDELSIDTANHLPFSEFDEDIKIRWKEHLTIEVLNQMYNICTIIGQNNLLTKEAEAREKTKIIEKRRVRRILDHPEGFDNYVASLYFDAITSVFDPHTNYMSKTSWQNFESLLTSEELSFGINLDESETGNILIESLVPGGPAWKSGQLNKDDVLLELQWEGKETVDLTASDIQEVEELMGQSNTQKLNIKIKKSSGEILSVSLIKEKIDNDDNTVKGLILAGSKKIGYISLPGFYSEFENLNHGCANDVAKEIIKLKEQKIDGLILDIRYNGGGSLYEGMNLAGIFIDEGPLISLKNRDGKTSVLKDMNRGTIYDGPLVVMVNSSSASASEVLASTLQDYNRAVIVGGNTYGKASGQIIIPLDTTVGKTPNQFDNSSSPHGFLKVTIEKLYRINGKSAQLKGVKPDITLPDIFDVIDYKESNYSNALPYDSINKKIIYQQLPALPINTLSKKSQQRIGSNLAFQDLNKFIKTYSDWMQAPVPLYPPDFKKYNDDRQVALKTLKKSIVKPTTTFKVENTSYENQVLQADPYKKELNDLLLKRTQSDIYIEESYSIITDLINSNNK